MLNVEDWVEICRLNRAEGMPIKAIARVPQRGPLATVRPHPAAPPVPLPAAAAGLQQAAAQAGRHDRLAGRSPWAGHHAVE